VAIKEQCLALLTVEGATQETVNQAA
jgi:hypothetical protein